nr:MAG TPA: hypothetical protein [Microviridae sp.]
MYRRKRKGRKYNARQRSRGDQQSTRSGIKIGYRM